MVGTPDRPGQLAVGLQLLSEEPERFVSVGFGTGASRLGNEFEAHVSARVMRELYGAQVEAGEPRIERVEHLLANPTIDILSQNTAQELDVVRAHMTCEQIWDFVGVSSASHLPRCVALGDRAFAGTGIRTMWVPSETRYEGSEPGDMVVFEHPHRTDDPLYLAGVQVNEVAASIFRVKDKVGIFRAIRQLVASYKSG
jgi:hypothetical protein